MKQDYIPGQHKKGLDLYPVSLLFRSIHPPPPRIKHGLKNLYLGSQLLDYFVSKYVTIFSNTPDNM